MTRRWRVPMVLGAILSTLLLGLGAPSALGAPSGPLRDQEDPGPGEVPEEVADPFDRLASCVGAQGRLLVVLLVDESASLRETDPDDQRVAVARAALRSIDLLRGEGTEGRTSIDVLVSTFSFGFAPVGDWTRLTAESRGAVDDRIAGLADRDESMDTDFHNALDGARQELADRATESTEDGGGEVCKAVLLFTDGNFTLGARTTADERERFGPTKEYAPGVVLEDEDSVAEVTRLGVEALCREGGVADQVRADRITLVSVPLGEGSGLLEAMTTGSAEGRTCGDPATDLPGVYLPASDTDELLRTFDLVASRIGGGAPIGDPSRLPVCADDPCDEGTATFTLSSALRRVHVFAAVPNDETRVLLVPPEGEALELVVGEAQEDGEAGGVPVAARWVAPRAVTADIEVPADGTGAGEWQVVLVGGEGEGLVQIVTFSDLFALLAEDTAVVLGEESTLAATIATQEGDDPAEELVDVVVQATITDPVTGAADTISLDAGEDGFAARYTVPEDVTSAAVRVSLRLDATTQAGASLSSVSPEQDLAVLRPPGYPQVSPPRLEVTSIVGDGTAEGVLVIVPPDSGAGCAWFEDLTVRDAPEEAGTLVATADGVGGSESDCTPIDEPLEVTVVIEADGRASGSVTGSVRLVLAREGADAPIATDVPVALEMARGIDQAKRLAVAAGLMVGGLLLPLLLLVAINRATTRFQDLSSVQGVRVPVVITPRDQIFRTDGGRRPFEVVADDHQSLEGLGGRRRFVWGGLEFRARTPANPFAEPYALVAPEEGVADVAREARRSDLALGLAGSWLFLLDPDATRAAGPAREIHGVLVAFTAVDTAAAQTRRVVGDVTSRTPAVARRLAAIAGLAPSSAGA